MARVAGITTKKSNQGKVTHVTLNVQKHRQAILPAQQELGVVEKTLFQKEFEKGFTIDESRKRAHAKIDSLWKK